MSMQKTEYDYSTRGERFSMDTSVSELMLSSLRGGLPGLSETWGQFLCEASACCFEFHKHPKGVDLKVKGISDTSFKVSWEGEITDQFRAAWNDEQELTEYGACGIAILLILKLTGFTVIQRARKGSGIDYWLGHKNAERPFQNAARLEVSGIMSGDANEIKKRVAKKRKQTQVSDDTTLPAFVAIVEFSEPRSHLIQR